MLPAAETVAYVLYQKVGVGLVELLQGTLQQGVWGVGETDKGAPVACYCRGIHHLLNMIDLA